MSPRSRLALLSLMLPLMAAPHALHADDGVPALLQFAEQYHRQDPPPQPADKPPSPAAQQPAVKTRASAAGRQQWALAQKALREKSGQLERQQATIQSLQQELTALRVATALTAADPPPVKPDLAALGALASGVRQALNLTPQEQQAQALIARARAALAQQKADSAKTVAELRQQVTQLQQQEKARLTQAEALQQRLFRAAEDNAQSTQRLDAAKKQAVEAEQALTAANQSQKALRDEIDGLRARARLLPDGQTLKKPQGQQSYAAGVALGRDIQALLAERQSWGVTPDKDALLAGVIDTFSGRYQLNEALLASALADSEKAVNQARDKSAKEQLAKGESFIAEFRKKKGIKKSSSGFWYRLDYAGDEAIPENALVSVVVKETLAGGRVIQDMDRSGKVLSQPLSAFPPLFREAIGYLKNHGSLTMVVPSVLAYGEAGYPPQIPPNATMVYQLRIVDVGKG
ncbi:FKBP-type peptidyl-prolyl cis-trans isomerase N-terminal domain-containing protein [Serratia ficaria]|uniref:FKBP-type peptidyl-prolyl cis-trans isomerase N-terminal domain-containing protein n=1 Tax=Serratia ficaria TaxID=61651 RepID=UPI00217B9258|nr:FKBP-type peptidyl-prolyl cis-trans isomerase N-terminal domain-containing protein [Serratia ficaria]CAI0735747.1 FKBP-type peptidyl-prolyl cis-trans isomerase fkpA precursor [Serratia ficaria]CAI0780741.1 FKBP-type peptidyl-prolyl cis-trans isomerase fkpA precursor [Serratia ficaria]CAI1625563.1 FKBP-type peptidyl-prolyl cis-trans isomerase fkpA precursor [Serratia ficaria]CAI2405095.1 FKBP-type peptidyl-prolyl cis-trans isomerase fkpA precursor [Serratia ficaria]CAI2441649.1 FKBP-type pep